MECSDKKKTTTKNLNRTIKNRVRTGCLTCRSRRLKCDEQKPRCRQCKSLDLKCLGIFYMGNTIEDEKSTQLVSAAVPIAPTGLPQINASSDIRDVLYLAQFASTQLGKDDVLSKFPTFIGTMSRMRHSYLAFLPMTAGRDTTLDGAVKCVAAALRQLYFNYYLPSPSHTYHQTSQAQIQSLYSQTLRRLQNDLSHPKRATSTEMLCTTVLLSLFESLLAETGQTPAEHHRASMEHIHGASQLIQHRGPHRFTTDFEKSLLTSQLTAIATAAWAKNSASFLHNEDWISALEASISVSEANFERSDLLVSQKISILPGLTIFSDVTKFIMGQSNYTTFDHEKQRLHLLQALETHRRNYKQWLHKVQSEADTCLRLTIADVTQPAFPSFPAHVEAICMGKIGYMMNSRVCAALGADNPMKYELRAQRIAAELASTYQKFRSHPEWNNGSITIGPSSSSILATADEWKAMCLSIQGKVVDSEFYSRWIRMNGIQI